ncbi:MAG TPA: hypothetical protein VGV37_06030 [Aliidongia sp.]|uniref:hypothetical protein n=1 Tax=Aliidongia sp. TaxID=1914230 RepID=UPI002DDD5962|nr:hypothetical protein [Aliidongia sp.]HEV2674082.1 hypothetical protein [Aliidongia sp.]
MDEEGSIQAPSGPGGVAVATYVSLFLLLFVFFIVLVSISEVQRPRARVVLDSIDAAFGHLPSSLGMIQPPTVPRPETGDVEGFARDVSGLLTGFAPLARTSQVAPSDSFLEIVLPEQSVFEKGSATPRSEVLPTLDRLALMMQKRTTGPGVRMTWRIMLPADAPDGGAAERLAGLRAATVVARLYAEGCPGDALAIAVDRGGGPALRLDFSIIDSDVPGKAVAP